MENIRTHHKKNSGVAMVTVVTFILFCMIVGVAMLAYAGASIQQGLYLQQMDKSYYAAESAAQVAAQAVFDEIQKEGAPLYRSYLLTPMTRKEAEEDFVRKVVSAIEARVNERLKNLPAELNKPVEIAVPINDMRENIIQSSNTFYNSGDLFDEILYIGPHTYEITASCEGRSVSVTLNCGVLVESSDQKFTTYNGFAYFEDKTGGGLYKNTPNGQSQAEYQTEKYDTYRQLIFALDDMTASVGQMSRETVLGLEEITVEDYEYGETYTEYVEWPWLEQDDGYVPNTPRAQYLKINGNATLLTGAYPYLEYLEVSGTLTVIGTVNCPNLKGVYVRNEDNTRTAVTVNMGARFHGITRRDGVLWNINKPVNNSVDFLIKQGDLLIKTNSEINWCRFYAQSGNVMIDLDADTTFTTNSLFFAAKGGNSEKGRLIFTGQGGWQTTAAQAPQFYAEGGMKLPIHNEHTKYEGLFATRSKEPVLTGNTAAACGLSGLFVGDMGNNPSELKNFVSHNGLLLMEGSIFDTLNAGNRYRANLTAHIAPERSSVSNLHEVTGK